MRPETRHGARSDTPTVTRSDTKRTRITKTTRMFVSFVMFVAFVAERPAVARRSDEQATQQRQAITSTATAIHPNGW